ncbi:ABC transporter permease [Streptomyces sp. NPDC053755]|uniref:ABC transporter permease n=1 Tax=Streptomyces sp. NPDC053755 TaxID=3155815 RepID=UPI00341FE126
MNPFFLGLRLLWGGGRQGRARFALMTFGCSLGVACLAAVLTIPGILAAHDARTIPREPQSAEMDDRSPNTGLVYLSHEDAYGAQRLRRVFLAGPISDSTPVPPGVSRLPAAGEVVVSPRLEEVLTEHPDLAGLLPGTVTGTIGPAGLTGPDELYAYIGTTTDQLADASPLHHFGGRYPRFNAVEESTLDILRFTLSCVVLLPLAVFLSVCARLSAESRARRLASLRLVGLSVKNTIRVNAAETVTAAFLGAFVGVGIYITANEIMARIGLPGLHWYPSDGHPTVSTLSFCLMGSPALAWFVGRHHARQAALTPLNVRRSAVGRPPNRYGTLLLVPGLGVIGGYCVLSVLGKDPSGGSANSLLVPGAVLLTGAGLVFGLAPATSWLASRLARTARSLPLALAMRRMEVEPGSSLRVVTGLVLLVYATSLTQGVLVELSQVSRNTSPVQTYRLSLAELSPQQRESIVRVEGVRSHSVVTRSWTPNSEAFGPTIYAAIGSCAQYASFTKSVSGCVDGKVLRLSHANLSEEQNSKPLLSYPFLLQSGRKFTVTVPKQAAVVHNHQLAGISPDVLVPPSHLPPGAILADSDLNLLSSSEPETVRRVLDGVGAIAPTARVQPVGIHIEALQQLTVIRSLLAAGMVLGLVISVAAFVVSVADRAMERRSQVTALVLLGARAGTLRAAQCVQVLVPLGVGLGAAVVTGWLAESSYLITGGGAVHWDWSGLPLLLACTLGVLVVAGVASLPLVRRHVDPEHIRRD